MLNELIDLWWELSQLSILFIPFLPLLCALLYFYIRADLAERC